MNLLMIALLKGTIDSFQVNQDSDHNTTVIYATKTVGEKEYSLRLAFSHAEFHQMDDDYIENAIDQEVEIMIRKFEFTIKESKK